PKRVSAVAKSVWPRWELPTRRMSIVLVFMIVPFEVRGWLREESAPYFDRPFRCRRTERRIQRDPRRPLRPSARAEFQSVESQPTNRNSSAELLTRGSRSRRDHRAHRRKPRQPGEKIPGDRAIKLSGTSSAQSRALRPISTLPETFRPGPDTKPATRTRPWTHSP